MYSRHSLHTQKKKREVEEKRKIKDAFVLLERENSRTICLFGKKRGKNIRLFGISGILSRAEIWRLESSLRYRDTFGVILPSSERGGRSNSLRMSRKLCYKSLRYYNFIIIRFN